MSDDQILFFENLNEISGGDEGFNKELLALFCSSSKETLANMDNSLQNKDFVAFGKLAHKIKFSINLIASEKLKKVVLELEKNKDYPESETIEKYHEFKDEVLQMIQLIESDHQ